MEEFSPFSILAGVLIGGASMFFITAHDRVAESEGGYSDNVHDLGGETMYGVTESVARRQGYRGPMKDLSPEQAAEIGYSTYWEPLHLDEIALTQDTVYEDVAYRLYDISFNAGPGNAGKILQRCLNSLNNQGRLYDDVPIDGAVGNRTMRAFRAYSRHRKKDGAMPLYTCIAGLQTAHYIRISEARKQNETFTYGWLKRLDS